MVIEDMLLSEQEISLLDELLSDICKEKQLRDLAFWYKNWEELEEQCPEILESLRIKGIVNIEQNTVIVTRIEDGEEKFDDKNVTNGKIQPKYLIESWLATIYHRSGKYLDKSELNQIDIKGSYYTYPIKIGSDTVTIKFVVKDADEAEYSQDPKDIIYVSFIGELPIKEQNYIHWFDPLKELSAAARFFIWVNEQSKPVVSKQYVFINIPTDLEKPQREEVVRLLNIYLEELNYTRVNDPKKFRPESLDYFFPEVSIRECYWNEQGKKVFVSVNGDRIEVHTFINGIKAPDEELTFHIGMLQQWIDIKAVEFRKLLIRAKSTFMAELLKIAPILIGVIITCYASVKLLFSQSQIIQDLPQSKVWLIIHIILGLIAVGVLVIVGWIPHLKYWSFSWDKLLKRAVKNNQKKLKQELVMKTTA